MKPFRYLLFVLLILSVSCVEGIEERTQTQPSESEMALMANLRTDLPPLASKALIDQNTTQSMDGNFLRIDENTAGSLVYEDWDNAYIVEASVVSSPNNKGNRSIYLNPVQSYKVTQDSNQENIYHHTRMIGWYPQTVNLNKDSEGKANISKLNFYNPSKGYDVYKKDAEGNVSIVFNNLDGTKDIMVSEVMEAQQYHEEKTGETDYRLPFGDNTVFGKEDRIFGYKHYLSAIKVYAKAEESAQVAGMWGHVIDAVVKSQPSRCEIQLPEVMSLEIPYKSDYPSAVTFEGETDYELEKGPIFGDAANDEIAPERPLLTDEIVYLGYSLVRPNEDILLDVHTESGIYSFNISSVQNDGGNSVDVFQPGYIYNIELDFKTDGTISALVFKDNQYEYFDLSSGVKLGDDAAHVYKLANSYIIDREKHKTASDEYYDGYAFYAGVMGNGDSGIPEGVNISSTEIDARSAALVWESKRGLITNVQLLYDYVRFRVNNDNYAEGNAVIAVYDSNNEIAWSWHIWITDTPEDRTFGDGDGTFVIMDRNLGALDNGLGLDSYGLYYQWGRKDPSMPPPSQAYPVLSTSTSVYYDYYGDEHNSAEIVNIPKPTVEDGIKNPMYLVLPTEVPEYYHYDWLYERQDHLWAYENDPNATVPRNKTIFDPCPFGYRTPKEEIGTIMVNAFDNDPDVTGEVQSYGIKITNGSEETYFPFAGYKGVDRGISSLTASWKYVGEKGDYMSANINATNNHRVRTYLSRGSSWDEIGADNDGDGIGDASASYNASKYDIDYANRRVAASVRCVKADTRLIGTMQVNLSANSSYILSSDPPAPISSTLKITTYTSSIKTITVKRVKHYEDGTTQEETISDIPEVSNPALYEEVILTIDASEINSDLNNKLASYEIIVLATNTTGVSKMQYVTIPVVNMGINNILVEDIDSWDEGDEVLSGTYYYGVQNQLKVYAQMPLTDGGANMYDLYVNGVKFNPVTKTENGNVVLDYFAGSIYIGNKLTIEFRTSDNSSVIYTKTLNATVEIPSNYTINESSATMIYSVDEMVSGACYVIVPSAYTSYYWADESEKLVFTQDLSNNILFIYHQDDNYISNVPTSYTYVSSGKIQNLVTGHYVASNSTDLILNETGESYIFASGANRNIYIYDSAGTNYIRYQTTFSWQNWSYVPSDILLGTQSQNNSWSIYQVPLILN